MPKSKQNKPRKSKTRKDGKQRQTVNRKNHIHPTKGLRCGTITFYCELTGNKVTQTLWQRDKVYEIQTSQHIRDHAPTPVMLSYLKFQQ